MIQSRPQFGYVGALLVWGVALIAYIGFNAFNQILAAQTVVSLYGGDPTLTILVFTLLSVSLAVIGYDLIHLAQRWIAYLLIAALLVFTVAVLARVHLPPQEIALRDFRAVPFLAQFFAAASYQIAWSIYVSDYSRYLPRDVGVGASFWWTYLGAFVGGTWMMLVGTLAAALYPTLEVATALRTVADAVLPGFGKPLLLCSLFGLVTITSLNYYGASLTLLSVMDSHQTQPSDARQASADPARIDGDRDQPCPRFVAELRREIRRVPGGSPVSVHALDRDQPGGLLPHTQRSLLGARDIQFARHVRALVLARPMGLRHRVRRDDAVLQHRVMEGPVAQGARRRRHRDAGGTAGFGAGVHRRVPLARCRGGSPASACRGLRARSRCGLGACGLFGVLREGVDRPRQRRAGPPKRGCDRDPRRSSPWRPARRRAAIAARLLP